MSWWIFVPLKFSDLDGKTIGLGANSLLGAASQSSFGKSSARRESTLYINANPSARTLSHPNESSPNWLPSHRNSHQNSLITHIAKSPKSPNSPRSPRSANFFSSQNATPNATPTSRNSSTLQILRLIQVFAVKNVNSLKF